MDKPLSHGMCKGGRNEEPTTPRPPTPPAQRRISLPENSKVVLLNREDRLFIYEQLGARKRFLEDELEHYYMKEGTKEDVLRVSGLIHKIQEQMNKLL